MSKAKMGVSDNFSKANFYDADNNITVKKNVALGLRARP
jgi:hypothetical protein